MSGTTTFGTEQHYCKNMLKTFRRYIFNEKRETPLPLNASDLLMTPDDGLNEIETAFRDEYPYRSVIGSVLHLAIHTCPRISYAVGVLSRFSAKPTYNACCLLTHLLQYLNGNPECKIIFAQGDWNLHGFSDADWAGCKITRRSTGGFIIFVMGGPIAWQSKLMLIVAKSSMESEYMALFHGVDQGGVEGTETATYANRWSNTMVNRQSECKRSGGEPSLP